MATIRRQNVKVYGPHEPFKSSKTEGLEYTAQRVHEKAVTLPRIPKTVDQGSKEAREIRRKYGL